MENIDIASSWCLQLEEGLTNFMKRRCLDGINVHRKSLNETSKNFLSDLYAVRELPGSEVGSRDPLSLCKGNPLSLRKILSHTTPTYLDRDKEESHYLLLQIPNVSQSRSTNPTRARNIPVT